MDVQIGSWRISLQDLLTDAFGLAGWLVAYLTYQWGRKESRLQALSEVLGPLCRAMQLLKTANNCRKTTEQIQRAFPDPSRAPDAVERVKVEASRYQESMEDAYK